MKAYIAIDDKCQDDKYNTSNHRKNQIMVIKMLEMFEQQVYCLSLQISYLIALHLDQILIMFR